MNKQDRELINLYLKDRRKKIATIFIIIFLIIGSVSIYIITSDYKEFREYDNITQELMQETIEKNENTNEVESIDWEFLKTLNEDIIGWIEIEGTNVNYPILKDKNLYYMNHSFDKKNNRSGSIFVQDSILQHNETIIYGHNMRNNSMFSNLEKFLNKDFLEEHPKIKIYTPNGDYICNIFSVYTISFEDEENNLENLNYEQKIEYYKNNSKYTINCKDNINKIIKLSTCSYVNSTIVPTNKRCYIVAYVE